MKVTKKSAISGKISTREIDITEEQLEKYYSGDQNIQHVFPYLSADDREFIMTGITPEEWNSVFGK